MSAAVVILEILAVWFAFSIVAGLLVGRVLGVSGRGER